MLADFIAATPVATAPPNNGHSLYDWFSDIVLPAVFGAGSFAVALVAVLVATRSNKLSAASTKAAERSNALARRALAHDEARAKEEDRNQGRGARETFAGRAVDALDHLSELLEQNDLNASLRAHDQVSLLQMEAVSRGYTAAPIAAGVAWLTTVNTFHGEVGRPDAFLQAKQSYHAALTAWAVDPDGSLATEIVLGRILQRRLDGDERPDVASL